MYVLIVYDIGEKRVAKVLKFLRKYMHWIQNSVFEGELSKGQLTEVKMGLKKIMQKEDDSVIIFTSRSEKWLNKEVMGKEKNPVTNFLD